MQDTNSGQQGSVYCWSNHLSWLVSVVVNQYSIVYVFKSVVWQQNSNIISHCAILD